MKPNNVIALFIAVTLIVAGLVLGAINQKSKQAKNEEPVTLQTDTINPGAQPEPEPEPTGQAKDIQTDEG